MGSANYYLAIVEDKPVILDALLAYFSSSPNFKPILAEGSAEQFFESWKEQRIDLLLCDVSLPGKSGVEVAWYAKRKSATTQIVMFTVFEDKETVFQAICAGASDYLLKNTPLPQVEVRLLEVLRGGSLMSPQVARMILGHFNTLGHRESGTAGEQLTTRETEIVSLLQQGDTYKQVAEKLSITIGTVKFHIRNVYGKLQLNSRGELINRYRRQE